ncbi:MAG TPA: hypothetical protein VLW53_01790 [Candidatus Eisenbacteria bacterium]|nr:hypothetical protein [Candidatus Eisenbacteria bacterium]
MAAYPEDLDRPLRRGELSLLGIGWREAAGPLWQQPYRNVHVWSAALPGDGRQRALCAAALLPPDAALGGWAAACLGNVPELDGLGPSGAVPEPVLLCLQRDQRVRRDASVRPLRSRLDPSDVTVVDGIAVTAPVRTAFDLARTRPLPEAVVALDVLARGRPDFLDEVAAYAGDRPRWLGAPNARRALALATFRSLSPGETRLRLFWQLDCGLPEPHVNPRVWSLDGWLLGLPDLLDDRLGLVGEYDGAGHRELRRHTVDNVREEGFEGAGLIVVRATGLDLGPERARTRARILAAARRAAEAPGPRRWMWQPGPLPEPTPHW